MPVTAWRFALVPTLLLALGAPLGAQEGDRPGPVPPGQQPPAEQSAAPTEADLRHCLEGLESRYFDDREAARQKLVQWGRSQDPKVAGAVREKMLAAAKSQDARVRAAAAEVLGAIAGAASAASVAPLVTLLSDEDAEVREAAIQAISRLGPEAQKALSAARAGHPELAEVLDRIGSKQVELAVEGELIKLVTPADGYGFYDGQFAKIVALGKPAVGVLLKMYREPEFDFKQADTDTRKHILRALAGEALADMGDKSIIPDMKKILEDTAAFQEINFRDPETLEDTTAYILFKLGEPSHIQEIRSRLESEHDGPFGESNRRLVGILVRMGDYAHAEDMYRRQLSMTGNGDALAAYNLSCILSVQGKKAEAIEYLRVSIKAGFTDYDWMKMDGDLTNLHGEEEYQQLMRDGENAGQKRPIKKRGTGQPR